MKNELSLPNNWQMKTLGDLFEITSSKRVFKKDWKTNGVPFYRAREIVKLAENGFVNNELFISEEMFKEYSEKYGLPKSGDIMVTGVGTLGICYVVKNDDRFYFKDGNIIWLKSTGKANSRYVEYAFKSDFLRKQIDDSVGATVGTYTIIKAKSTKIPLPPLPEQQRIVAILDKTFSAIDKAKANAEQNLKNAKELFESYLQGVFENKGEGWEEKKLGEVCKTGAGGTPLKAHKEYYEDGTIPWLLSGEVSQGEIFQAKNFITEKGLKNSSAKLFPPNTVLVAMYGATAGQVGILRFESTTNQAVCGILPNENFIAEFLYYKFLAGKELLVSQAVGGAQPNISQTKIKNTLVPIISIKEQQTIVRQLDALRAETQKLEAVYQQKIADLEELKKSILQKAFSGQLSESRIMAD